MEKESIDFGSSNIEGFFGGPFFILPEIFLGGQAQKKAELHILEYREEVIAWESRHIIYGATIFLRRKNMKGKKRGIRRLDSGLSHLKKV